MQISNSTTSIAAGYSRTLASSMSEQLSVWRENPSSSGESIACNKDELILSDDAKAFLAKGDKTNGIGESGDGSPKMGFIKHFLEKYLGVKIRILELEELDFAASSTHVDTQTGSLQVSNQTSTDSNTQTNSWAASLDYSSSHYESQKISFSLEGSIHTKDGQELGFKLDLNVSREFAAHTNLSMQASESSTGAPFAIDFNGLASELGDQMFAFGLDGYDLLNLVSPVTADSKPTASSEVTTTDDESAQSSSLQTGLQNSNDIHHNKPKHSQGNHYGYRDNQFAPSDKSNRNNHASDNKHESPRVDRTG